MTDDGIEVGIDVSAIPDEPRGAGKYAIELVSALARRSGVSLHLQARRGDADRWTALASGADVRDVVPRARVMRLAWEQVSGPRFVDRWGIDVHHGPHYTTPEIAKVPKVVTVHDLTFFDHPQLHEKVKVAVFKRAIRVAAKVADAIVCVSDPTARRLRELLDPQCPVHVIPHGIDHATFRPDAADDDPRALEAAGVTGRYVAFVGTLEPRKDLTTLVRAFNAIAYGHGDLQLVVAGGRGWGNEQFDEAVVASPFSERIVRTGYLPPQTVPALLRSAEAVIYPAIEEGFGLPVLEALACGATVVTTSGSVMDELADGAALVVPRSDAGALAERLDEILSGGQDAARRERGIEVASRYHWERTASAHEDVYRSVADRHWRTRS